MIELVVTDLDGTLWDRNQVVPAPTLEALLRLDDAGIPVLAATSRRSWTVKQFFTDNGIDLPVVLLNGALGRHETTRSVFHSEPFDGNQANRVLDCFADYDIVPVLYVEQEPLDLMTTTCSSSVATYLEKNHERITEVDDLRDVVAEHLVFAFSVMGYHDIDRMFSLADSLRSLGAEPTVVMDKLFGGATLDTRSTGISKWSGVLAYCKTMDIDPTKVTAVGDDDNDVELLRNAALSFAMHDSSIKALREARVRLPAGDDGWSAIVDHVSRHNAEETTCS